MSQIALWMYFAAMISGFTIVYFLEARSLKKDELKLNKTNEDFQRWRNLEARSKKLLILLSALFSLVIAGFLYRLRLLFFPVQADIEVIINPTMTVWILPALYIGVTFAGLLIDKLTLSGITGAQKESFRSYQRGKYKIKYERFCRRIALVTLIPSLFLIMIWMNTYFYIDDNLIIFNNGIPWGRKQYDLSAVRTIKRSYVSGRSEERKIRNTDVKIIFFDGFVLDMDKEYFFSSKHLRSRMVELLSLMGQVEIEEPGDVILER